MGRKCNCQKPPGGGVDCPDESLAICRNENGECKGYCRPIPSSLSQQELENWVLGEITGESRSQHQWLSYEDRQILNEKQFVTINAQGQRVIIRFDFPDYESPQGLKQSDMVSI